LGTPCYDLVRLVTMASLTLAKPADLSIPKLTTANYKIWKELATAALKGRGIWGYTDGSVKEPKEKADKDIWYRNNAMAVGIIKGSLSDVQLGHVMGVDDAKTVWDILKGIHEMADDARVQSLIAEFIQFRLHTTIDEGASTLTRLQSEIGTLDSESKPSDAVKVQTLLAGLGLEYESTLAALQVSKTKKFEEVVAQLRIAETRLADKDMGDQHRAYRTVRSGFNKPRTKRMTCFHCGEAGHFIKECEEFRQQVKDEEGYKGSQKTAMVQRPVGSPGRFHARGIAREPDISERAW